jgi:hypothetical protein
MINREDQQYAQLNVYLNHRKFKITVDIFYVEKKKSRKLFQRCDLFFHQDHVLPKRPLSFVIISITCNQGVLQISSNENSSGYSKGH